jgi:serine/threonine protein kinase
MEYAHQRAIVHRDLKPSNILVESTGRVLVVDFGISKIMSGNTLEDTLTFIGTPLYMSPEQCGEGPLDHRTDIYSLGVIFYEMLTGKPPFAGNTPAEIIKNHLLEAPTFPKVNGQELPPKIIKILRKMLAKNPDNRYPDALTLAQELTRYRKELRAASRKPAQEVPSLDADDASPLVVCYIPQKILLGSVSFALKDIKHRLLVTNTIHELLSRLAEVDANLVILSSYTGRGGVFELAGRVRDARNNPSLRILLLSHGISRPDVGKAFANGINDIVAEPFDPSIMVSKLENALLGKQKTVESRRYFRKPMSGKVSLKIDTDILDISEGGMRIAATLPLRIGEILTFDLQIFRKLGLGEKSGRVVWVSKEDPSAPLAIQAGIDFVNVTQNERDRLQRWILSSDITEFPITKLRIGRTR